MAADFATNCEGVIPKCLLKHLLKYWGSLNPTS